MLARCGFFLNSALCLFCSFAGPLSGRPLPALPRRTGWTFFSCRCGTLPVLTLSPVPPEYCFRFPPLPPLPTFFTRSREVHGLPPTVNTLSLLLVICSLPPPRGKPDGRQTSQYGVSTNEESPCRSSPLFLGYGPGSFFLSR